VFIYPASAAKHNKRMWVWNHHYYQLHTAIVTILIISAV